jgi:hypothetical protein
MNPNEPVNPFNTPPEAPTPVTPEPTPQTAPGPTTPPPQPAAQSNNKTLIIILSIVGGLILVAGIILTIILLSNKKEDVSSTDKKPSSSEEKPQIIDESKDSADNPTVTTDTNANGERELSCQVTNLSEQPIDMTMLMVLNKQENVSRVVYEYRITNGQTITQAQLSSLESSMQQQFATYGVVATVNSQVTSTGTGRMTVTSSDWSKAGYTGGYASIKKTFEAECATYDGTFNGLTNIAD